MMATRRKAPVVEPKPKGPHVRWMIRRDMDEVLEIEKLCFEFPWDEESFIRTVRQRNCIAMAVDVADKVVGYMVYELHKSRLHILNFAVMPAMQKRGFGRAMHNKLARKLSLQFRTRILLEVRESNVDAQLFWKALGYQCISTLRNHYEDTDEDAYVMQFVHGDADAVSVK